VTNAPKANSCHGIYVWENLVDRCEQQKMASETAVLSAASRTLLTNMPETSGPKPTGPHWRRAKTISMKPSAAQAEAASFKVQKFARKTVKQK
jgi:hypothetical protein